MPTVWKKAKLGARLLASTLGDRAKRGVGDSPLVVQAGFPTSVADLVVKNRGRLKKTPRWLRRPRSPEGAEAGCSAVAVRASQIVAAVASAEAGRPPSLPPEPAESELEQEEGPLPAAAAVKPWRDAVSEEKGFQSPASHTLTTSEARSPEGKAPPESEVPQSFPRFKAPKCEVHLTSSRSKKSTSEGPGSSPREDAGKSLEEGNRRGPRMMAKVLFLVFVLAIGTKKVAFGVSLSAFAILFLQAIGRRLLPFLKPCGESTKKWSNAVAARVSVSDLLRPPEDGSSSNRNGRAPIKNAGGICDPNLGSSQSGRSSDSKILVELTSPVVQTADRASHFEAEGSREDQKSCPRNRNAKKLLSKLVPKKLRVAKGGRRGKVEGKPDPASDSSSKGASGRRGEGEGPSAAAEEDGGGLDDGNGDGEEGGLAVHGFEIPACDRFVGLEDAAIREEKVDESTNGSAGHLVFFVIVLSGLVGGRIVAMLLIVLWYSLVKSARSLWKRWKVHQKPV